MWLPFDAPIWLYRQPVDFRKQIDGLVMLVADTLHHNPTTGQLFVFRNKQADKVKLLYWEDNGFWLLYKRIEKGRFCFPGKTDQAMGLTKQQLQWLLSGLDIMRQRVPKPLVFSHFVSRKTGLKWYNTMYETPPFRPDRSTQKAQKRPCLFATKM